MQLGVTEVVVGGLSGGSVVALLVQIAKTWGLPDRWAPQASHVAGLLVSAAYYLAQPGPPHNTVDWWAQLIITGLTLGIVGSGVYSQVVAPQKQREQAALSEVLQAYMIPQAVLKLAKLKTKTKPKGEHDTGQLVLDEPVPVENPQADWEAQQRAIAAARARGPQHRQ